MHQLTPEQLFADLLASRPAQPFVTYYDEASGERSELSAKSLANWVAKTHHLIADELGLGVGDTAFLAVPTHWISVPALLGCLTAGLAVADRDPAGTDVGFVEPATAAEAFDAGVPDVFCVAPESAAVGFAGSRPPPGTTDFVVAVRPQEDKWPSVHLPAGPDDFCFEGMTRRQVVQRARERAGELGLTTGVRAITTRDWVGPSAWIDTLFAPLAVGGSVVYVRHCTDDAVLERRMEQERATVRV
jgi:uncharacterized protein (TIGR03089 family)